MECQTVYHIGHVGSGDDPLSLIDLFPCTVNRG